MSYDKITALFEASVRDLGEKVAKAQDELLTQIAQKFGEALGCEVPLGHLEVRPHALHKRLVLFNGLPFCYIVTTFNENSFTVSAEPADIGGYW